VVEAFVGGGTPTRLGVGGYTRRPGHEARP